MCPYCDFAVTIAGEDRRAAWQKALHAEALMYADGGWAFDTVYFGGGTPSILDLERLADVVNGLRSALCINEKARYFLEINPEDASIRRIRAWSDLGFTFASVGLQSPDDGVLHFLGRRHSAEQGRLAIERLKEEHFRTVSADLIFGLPGQGPSDWRRQLEAVIQMGVDHISCYQLTIHDGTIFGRRRRAGVLREAPDDIQADLYELTHAVLADAGFEAYEVSNFARPGHRSKHNQKYWKGVPYLGFGPGAHSFDGTSRRWWNRGKLRLWQRDIEKGRWPLEDAEDLAAADLAFEVLMLGLRQSDGVDLKAVECRWGVAVIDPNRLVIERLVDNGLITVLGTRIQPTMRGMAVADGLAREFEV
ncbi:MAG: coproporphyrinogen III oxidase family protein [Thermoanaerobaculales bacterium]|nr:coproporphyrinogen III oxidase family protein [Thermoanaerobaculales bacterium]